MAKNLSNKPLKGTSLNVSSGVFDTISANNIVVSDDTLTELIDGAQMSGITIVDSELVNTIIGINGPSEGYFTTIVSQNDIIFNSLDNDTSFNWDSNTGILTIDGKLVVTGCSTLGNLQICGNTIQAINFNGDINLNPNNLGTLRFNGPVNILTTNGNFTSSILNGNFSVLTSSDITLTSISSGINLTSFDDQNYNINNGNFIINTDTLLSTKSINNILYTLGNTIVSANTITNLKINDTITLTSPVLNGIFSVSSILNNSQFTISSGSTLSSLITSGSFIKNANNSIFLNASKSISIPDNIPIILGSNGNLYNSSNAIYLTSSNDINLKSENLFIKDSNPVIFNTSVSNSDLTDRGLQFKYYENSSEKLGWFGWKKSTSKFTFLKDVTNNSKVFTGTLGEIELGDTSIQNLTFGTGASINLNCGSIANVRVISPCSTYGTLVNGNLNVYGSINWSNPGDYIYPLGTSQVLDIVSVSNSTTSGVLQITSNTTHYLSPGDLITIGNSNTTPFINRGYIVNSTISNTQFTISSGTSITNSGTGNIFSNLKIYQGKDIGLRLNYWSTVGNTSVTSGTANYRNAFFGRIDNTERFVYYNNATISNNIVTNGILGDMSINELFPNKISSFVLDGTISGGSNAIIGSNFIISGGSINSTPIGQSIPSLGTFTQLTSTNFTTNNIYINQNIIHNAETILVTSSNSIINPDISKTTTFIKGNITNATASGFLTSVGVQSGQIKKFIFLGNTSGSFFYSVRFTSGTLYTPNPLSESNPINILFKRPGQSCDLMFNGTSWFLTGGTGAYIS